MQISYADTVLAKNWKPRDLDEILHCIKGNDLVSMVGRIRTSTKEKATTLKVKLPAFCPSALRGGTRTIESVVSASLIVLDIDGVSEGTTALTDACHVRDDLVAAMEDGQCVASKAYAVFVSPSGNGIKAIYLLSHPVKNNNEYSRIYRALSKEFIGSYGDLIGDGHVDRSTSDIVRATFLSHDPGIYISDTKRTIDVSSLLMSEGEVRRISVVSEDFVRPGKKSAYLKDQILRVADQIVAPHYCDFRNLCNAVSSFGDLEFLHKFASTIRDRSFTESGPQTAVRIDRRWDQYMQSFFSVRGTPQQIPLDYIFNEAHRQGITIELNPDHAYSDSSYFDPTKVEDEMVAAMNERYMIIASGETTKILEIPEFSHIKDYRLAKPASIKFDTKPLHAYTFGGDGKKKKKTYYFDAWVESPKTPRYAGVDFDPAQGSVTQSRKVNIWDGYSIQHEIDSGVCGCGELPYWDRYVSNLFEGDKDQKSAQKQYLLNWISHIIQHPEKKTGVAITLIGGQGTGKTFLGTVIEALTAPYNTRISNSNIITSQYTDYIEGTVFLFVDESTVATDKATKAKLKAVVTDDKLTIERKYRDTYSVRNFANLMYASNEAWTQNIDADDRRNQIFRVSNEFKQDTKFFSALYAELFDNGGIVTLFEKMLKNDVSKFNFMRDRIRLDAQTSQAAMSLQGVSAWLHDVYTGDGEFFFIDPRWRYREDMSMRRSIKLKDDIETDVDIQVLFAGYRQAVSMSSNKQMRGISTSQRFSREVKKAYEDLGFELIIKHPVNRKQTDGARKTIVTLPGLRHGLESMLSVGLVEDCDLIDETTCEEKNTNNIIEFKEKQPIDENNGLTGHTGLLYSQYTDGDEIDVPF